MFIALASEYGFGPDTVSGMTPAQANMYLNAARKASGKSMIPYSEWKRRRAAREANEQ